MICSNVVDLKRITNYKEIKHRLDFYLLLSRMSPKCCLWVGRIADLTVVTGSTAIAVSGPIFPISLEFLETSSIDVLVLIRWQDTSQ